MADISTAWDVTNCRGDWFISPTQDSFLTDQNGLAVIDGNGQSLTDGLTAGGGIIIGGDLITAVMISLFTDQTAGPDDVIPDQSGDPRGWWGDLGADRPIGSKLWLRMRSKQTATVLALVKNDIEQALEWLTDDGVAASVGVTTQWDRAGMLAANIVIVRANGTTVSTQFNFAWTEIT